MHTMLTIKKTVCLAIMQFGVIIGGIFAGRFLFKRMTGPQGISSSQMPMPITTLVNHALVFLAIPFVWLVLALLVRRRLEISSKEKNLYFCFGVLLLLALAVFVIYADVTPMIARAGSSFVEDNGKE